MAPLQKRALYSFVIGLILACALAAVFIIKDINTFDEDEGFRYIVYGLWVGVPVVYLILINLTLRKPTQIDERDRLIMERASKTQFLGVILSLAAWVIALTEAYWKTGEIPVVFLTIIIISVLIVSTLAQSLGILIGYWSMNK